MRFIDTLDKAVATHQIPMATRRAQQWNQFAAKQVGSVSNNGHNRPDVMIGGLYMFHYDPKHKDTLPFYDTFPIIFPIDRTEDGFIGLNLHYLHPRLRARLFDALMDYKNNTKMDKTTKLKISYQILKSAMNNKLFVPCVKRYLSSHVRSSFLYIEPQQWSHAMLLPLQSFQKKTANQVWDITSKQVNKR